MLKTAAISGEVPLVEKVGGSLVGGHRDLCYSLQHVPSLIQEMRWYSSKTTALCITTVKCLFFFFGGGVGW